MPRIIERELSFKVIGLCFQTHKKLGRFAREKQYGDRLEELFKQAGLNYKRECEIQSLKGGSPKGNKTDFIVENKLILDLKAKPFITKEDYYQMQRYLKAANLELGMIINFRAYKLSPKRVLNSNYLGHSDTNLGH
jgi:GxxExxY protein